MAEIKDLFTHNSTLYKLQFDSDGPSRKNFKLIKTPSTDTDTLKELPSHFSNKTKVYVIDSVTSGVGREDRDLYDTVLKQILDDLNISHHYIETGSPDAITKFASSLDRSKDYTLIVLSGDTSIFEIVNTVQSKNNTDSKVGSIKIALFPFGTGNSISHGFHIFDEADSIKNMLFNDFSSKLPVYKVLFPEESYDIMHGAHNLVKELYFICVVSTAIHAQLVYEADKPELRKLGIERFKLAVAKVLQQPDISYKGELFELETHKKIIQSDNVNYAMISAVPYIEKNYLISPDSNVAHNELHLITFSDYDHVSMPPSLMLPYNNGAHIGTPNVEYHPLKKGLIYKLGDEPNERSNVCVDGAVIQIENPKDKEIIIEILDDSLFQVDIIGAKK